MRLDKFLQTSRLVKRRTIADAMCSNGRVRVNGQTAKPATAVKVGDRIEIEYRGRRLTATVRAVPEGAVRAAEAASLVEVTERTHVDADW
ncbi:MAG: RNA-binding S4 domain-containing protein [Armatimonadetes bacterium]|nr:RNA-binding S4 domain-containing protein [Armatimonadota bacterium]